MQEMILQVIIMVDILLLLDISASAPTAEQVKKMYEDEKVLFQENAKATYMVLLMR